MSRRNVYEKVKREDEVRTFTDVVKIIENELGWAPSWDDPRPTWKVRSIEVGKMKRVIKALERRNRRMKGKFTVANLALTVEVLKRERHAVTSPSGILYHVERALEMQAEEETHTDEAITVQQALAEVEAADLPDVVARAWRTRLVRSQGEAREEAVAEWRAFQQEEAHG